ncbi:MAG: sialidase family protein [Bryobacteraceae bacterium]
MNRPKSHFSSISRRDTLLLGLTSLAVPAKAFQASARHLVVYKESGKFGGWPANEGIWAWGNEVVVGFQQRVFERKEHGHAIKVDVAPVELQGRTLDGGETWSIEQPPNLALPSGEEYEHFTVKDGPKVTQCPGGINFQHPDFAFSGRMSRNPPEDSRFYYSLDRCKTWNGPYRFPRLTGKGTAARTDYLVNGKHDLYFLLAVAKSNGEQGRVILAQTRDGAKTWSLVSYIGPEPKGEDYAIMPSTVRLDSRRLVSAIRHRGFIEVYRSVDNGKSWEYAGKPVPNTGKGNPGSLVRMRDGRLVLSYGYRAKPYGMRACVSEDDGKTWGRELILRQDGGSSDIGYPCTVQRVDGKLLTVYYYNTDINEERYIAATIWDPDHL